ncbi:hypothetical protein ES707_18255 [subsurface metagenome]
MILNGQKHPDPEPAPQAPRRETGLAQPQTSAIYASQFSLRALPYSAGRHI